jgi:hypothetical protein
MSTTTNAIEKLPKWARDEILQLRRSLAQREATIAELSKTEDAKDALISWSDMHSSGALPLYAKVRFKTPEGHIDAWLRDGVLRIDGWRQLVIAPVAANSFKVFVQEVD